MDSARQRISRAGDEGVRLGEASQGGVVPAGVVVHQPEGIGHAALAGVGVVRRQRAGLVAHRSPGMVAQFGDLVPLGVRDDAGGAEVVAEKVVQCAVYPHGDALRTGIVVETGYLSRRGRRGGVHLRRGGTGGRMKTAGCG